MSLDNKLKNFEKNTCYNIWINIKRRIFHLITFLQRQHKDGRGKYSVAIIPHTHKKGLYLRTSFLAIIISMIFLVLILGGVVLYSTKIPEISSTLTTKEAELKSSESHVETLRKEIGYLRISATKFEASLNQTLAVLGIDSNMENKKENLPFGSLSYFLNKNNSSSNDAKELEDLNSLSLYLDQTSKPIEEIGKLLKSQEDLLVDIPTLWPVQNGQGVVTAEFGPAIHPFTGEWYLHKGIDIAARTGTPVISTANGVVVEAGYDRGGYGNYVLVRHKYGFFTKYPHLSRIIVTKSQVLKRGDVVGLMGMTGTATGPHVHYEIHLGTQVVDPRKYLQIPTSIIDKK
ncbi:M23 family metallopeptidase [Spirochaeta cellobiosiphila]|uniref:M23 family metallopeptidase n=1 Tax=Spirochaeta cellobiosiphila TaxID=504483 RepID=UPI00069E7A0F|nr:M23 family metallopeptidase [Spirochaeta cellobiosiphila]